MSDCDEEEVGEPSFPDLSQVYPSSTPLPTPASSFQQPLFNHQPNLLSSSSSLPQMSFDHSSHPPFHSYQAFTPSAPQIAAYSSALSAAAAAASGYPPPPMPASSVQQQHQQQQQRNRKQTPVTPAVLYNIPAQPQFVNPLTEQTVTKSRKAASSRKALSNTDTNGMNDGVSNDLSRAQEHIRMLMKQLDTERKEHSLHLSKSVENIHQYKQRITDLEQQIVQFQLQLAQNAQSLIRYSSLSPLPGAERGNSHCSALLQGTIPLLKTLCQHLETYANNNSQLDVFISNYRDCSAFSVFRYVNNLSATIPSVQEVIENGSEWNVTHPIENVYCLGWTTTAGNCRVLAFTDLKDNEDFLRNLICFTHYQRNKQTSN